MGEQIAAIDGEPEATPVRVEKGGALTEAAYELLKAGRHQAIAEAVLARDAEVACAFTVAHYAATAG